MKLMFLAREQREGFCLKWINLGLYFFLSAFFWASGPAPLRTIFYLFILLPLLAVLPWRRWRMEEYGGYFTLSAMAFSGYSVMASLWGKPEDFDFFLKQWVFLAFWLCGIALLFYHRAVNLPRLCLTIIVIGFVCALVTLFLFYGYHSNPISSRLMGVGMVENSTVVAQTFGVAALLAYVKSLQACRWWASAIYFSIAIICAMVILMSQSRGAAIALVLVSCAAAVIIRPRISIWLPQILIILIASLILFFGLNIGAVLEARGISFSERDEIWHELVIRSFDHLFFGIGYEENSRIIIPDLDVFHHAHNSWLDILYYSGLVGVLLSLWHLSLVLASFNRDRDMLPLYLWFAYSCICLFTNGSSLLTRPDAQWLMYWVPAGLIAALVMSRRR